jgi:hypothetical protein
LVRTIASASTKTRALRSVNTGLSRKGLRLVFWLITALGEAGCASTTATPADAAQWRRVKGVPGCVSADSQWDVRDQFSVRLQPELQSALMEHLQEQPLENPQCWYQIPNGDLLLRAGSFCGLSQEAQFHSDGSRWTLVRVEHILGQCGTKDAP